MSMTASRTAATRTLPNGTKIYGKWHHHHYQVISYIGHGAQGDVYLARSDQGYVALKFPREHSVLSMEMNVLRHLKKVQGIRRGPSLFEIDDWLDGQKIHSFYVMDYIHGTTFEEFTKSKGFEWCCVLMVQLLGELHALHQAGWVFGDLKPDNLIIEQPQAYLRWLDPGGMTKINRSVREYSTLYDRGFWKMGSRKAEPSYDLFAVAIIIIGTSIGNRWDKTKQGNPDYLFELIRKKKFLGPYRPVLEKAIKGKYENALEMKKELLHILSETKSNTKRTIVQPVLSRMDSKRKKRRRKGFSKAVFIMFVVSVSILVFLYLGSW